VFVLDTLATFLRPLQDRWSDPDGLFFGVASDQPFEPRAVERKAQRALASGDERFTFHEARHSFSTWLDAAGISETRADRYMGHAAPGVAGRYRHQLPGQIAEDAKRVDAYLDGAAPGRWSR
jgi:integrase